MSRENYDSRVQDERGYQTADEALNSELPEKKDPVVNPHNYNAAGQNNNSNEHANPRPDERDPDADRRTLDEEKPVDDDDDN